MNLQFYLEKLFESAKYKEFKSKNPKAYFCSGFFSIDKQGNDNQQHIDFYEPLKKNLFTFQLEKSIEQRKLEDYDKRTPNEIKENLDFELNEIERMIKRRMELEKINKEIQKLLLSLQNKEGKNYIVGTIFISGMGILKINIDLDEKKITEFEKKTFFDMMKIIRK